MGTFTEPDILSQDIANKVHDFDSDTFRLALTNTLPAVATTWLLSDVSQIVTANGYTRAADGVGMVATLSFSRTGQVTSVTMSNSPSWTATGVVGPFRWVVWINDTPTTPLNPVIGWVDHGSNVTMASTDTYTVPTGVLFTLN